MSDNDKDKVTPPDGEPARHGSDGPPDEKTRKAAQEAVVSKSEPEKPEKPEVASDVGRKSSRLEGAAHTDHRPHRDVGRRPLSMAIGAGVLLGAWGLVWLITGYFSTTLLGVGLTLFGMMWYTMMRRRSCADGIIFYSHNQIIYYWPIWLGAFIMSDLTGVFGQDTVVEIRGEAVDIMVSSTPSMGLFFLIIIATVIFFTSVNIRGVWAVVLGVSVVATGLVFTVFDWWTHVLSFLGDLTLFVNRDFYSALGIVLFFPWFAVVFLFDMRRYFHFLPTQIKMVNEIGEGEKNFDSLGVVMEKQRDNFVQHMGLGFGSGDLIITTSGGQRDIITFPNVLRIDTVLDEIQVIRERRGRDVV